MVPGLADSQQSVFWLDSPQSPEPLPRLVGEERCELAVVGGGFTGLWAALVAAERGSEVALLEGDRCGCGASGRNGGVLEASLTHGLENGLSPIPFPPEPLRYAAVQATAALARADARGGRRGRWLQLLDRIGTGFDS